MDKAIFGGNLLSEYQKIFTPSRVLFSQGFYFVLTGLWPVLHPSSFLSITGPKTDIWLLQTLGLIIACIGSVFLSAFWRREISFEVHLLASLTALAFTLVDIVFVLRQVLSWVYLLDGIIEMTFLAFWLSYWNSKPKEL